MELKGIYRFTSPTCKSAQEQFLNIEEQLKMAEDTIMNLTESAGPATAATKKMPALFMVEVDNLPDSMSTTVTQI